MSAGVAEDAVALSVFTGVIAIIVVNDLISL